MVRQTWIFEYLKMYKISDKIINFISNDLKNWKVELTVKGKTLAEVKIQKRIFHGSSLLPLLFVMPLNYVLKKYTG